MSNDATTYPIESQLVPGVVLNIYFDTINPPNNKFVILIENRKFPLFFFINSEINAFTNKRPELLQCQVNILKEPNHTFLSYDSYIDCSKMKDHYSLDEFIEQIEADPRRIVGVVDQTTRFEIIKKVKNSRLYSTDQKELITKNFSF